MIPMTQTNIDDLAQRRQELVDRIARLEQERRDAWLRIGLAEAAYDRNQREHAAAVDALTALEAMERAKAASDDFQAAMHALVADAGESATSLDVIRDGLLKIAAPPESEAAP